MLKNMKHFLYFFLIKGNVPLYILMNMIVSDSKALQLFLVLCINVRL